MQAPAVFDAQPNEWGRWGPDDQIGRANLLTEDVVLRAVAHVRKGRRFALALPIAGGHADPCLPGRQTAARRVTRSEASYRDGDAVPERGGMKYVDDRLELACHGTTHMDALGHAYAGDRVWNGHPAVSTHTAGVPYADIAALSARGVVGRAVLIDIARAERVDALPMHREITVADIETTLAAQGTTLLPGDTIVVRTGSLAAFYRGGADAYFADFHEPGLGDAARAVAFFVDHQLAGLGSDTLCNERAHHDDPEADFALHVLLQRNLGVLFHEALWLEEWAADCAEDGVYEALYVAAPLRLIGGSGAPMNPVVIK